MNKLPLYAFCPVCRKMVEKGEPCSYCASMKKPPELSVLGRILKFFHLY